MPERATAGGGASGLDRAAAAYGLSELETTIFKQLLEGRTIARIAQDLYLSPSAVKYHAQKIYRSCNVHTRSELSALMRPPLPAPAPARANPCARLAAAHGLTDRESQTLELLARGATVAAIASALDVSENTVKTYAKRVYKKLDVHSKQDIIDLCREEAGTC